MFFLLRVRQTLGDGRVEAGGRNGFCRSVSFIRFGRFFSLGRISFLFFVFFVQFGLGKLNIERFGIFLGRIVSFQFLLQLIGREQKLGVFRFIQIRRGIEELCWFFRVGIIGFFCLRIFIKIWIFRFFRVVGSFFRTTIEFTFYSFY